MKREQVDIYMAPVMLTQPLILFYSKVSFTHPHGIPNLYDLLSFVKHKRRYFEECW